MRQMLGQRTPTTHPFGLLLELTKSPSPGLQAKSDSPMADCYQATATRRLPMRVLLPLSTALVLCVVFSISPSAIAQSTFTNPTPIFVSTIENFPPAPYPSNIAVSGLSGSVTKVTVTLNNLNFESPSEADILLVGPNGQSVMLMSDASEPPPGSIIYNIALTFDDAALSPLPSDLPLRSGSYKPTDLDPADDYSDVFPAPAPVGPYGTTLSVFNGTNPNGTWSLYTADDIPWDYWDYDQDVISGGWSLTVTASTQSPPVNPIDEAQSFVRQHYLDFLNREPDQGGLAYWTNEITKCGTDARCIHSRRIGVSAAFFIESEFQDTGYVVYRLHRAAYGEVITLCIGGVDLEGNPCERRSRANVAHSQFVTDRVQLDPGLPQSTINFANNFVQRTEFKQAYSEAMTPPDFVNKLFDTANLTGSANASQRQTAIDALTNGSQTRAQVLLDVIEISEFKTREHNPAFVLMQYFGYLQRDPDEGGYYFWLDVLNNREANNFRGLVCAFITSAEYQLRFGSAVTRSDADCAQ